MALSSRCVCAAGRSLDVSLFEQSFGGQNFLKMCFDGWKDRVGKGEAEPTAAVAEEGVLEDQHISDETKGTIAEHCHDKVARKMKEHVDMDKLKQDVIVLQGQLTTAMADFSELKDQTAAAVAQQAAANATGQPVAAPAPAGMSQEQAKDMEEKAAAVDVKLAEHEEKLFATAEELKTVVEEADRARVVEESAAEDISFLKKEVEDIKSELKPVGNDARGAAASVTALNVQMGKTEQQVDKIQLGLEKTEAAVFATPAGLEPRVGQLELALRRLAGAVDIKVRDPTAWTITRHDGPNHLGFWLNEIPEHQMALITSVCAPCRRRWRTRPRSWSGCWLARPTRAKSKTGWPGCRGCGRSLTLRCRRSLRRWSSCCGWPRLSGRRATSR